MIDMSDYTFFEKYRLLSEERKTIGKLLKERRKGLIERISIAEEYKKDYWQRKAVDKR